MAAAAPATDLGADHAEAVVLDQLDGLGHRRLREARPPAARLELGVGTEQDVAARRAAVGPVVVVVHVLPRPRTLGAGLPQHLVLLRREHGAPLLVGLVDLLHILRGCHAPRVRAQASRSPGRLAATGSMQREVSRPRWASRSKMRLRMASSMAMGRST